MKRTVFAIVAAAAALGLAGCSGAAQSASVTGSGQTPAAGTSPTAPGPGGGRFPGVSGLVAAVSGTTAQVQGATQQTAVSWTSTTRFTAQVATTAAAVKVGECVMARPARGAAGTGGSGSTGTPTTTVAAATVELLPGQGGSCSFGALGGFGGRTGARPSGTPSAPATPGSGAGGGAGRRGFGAVGTVSAVGSGQFTVSPVGQAGGGAVTPLTVDYTSSTTFTRLAAASASAVKVGVCVTAQGRTDDTGALTARSIAVSAPTNGTCQSGFGGRFGGGRGTGAPSTAGAGNA
ncbi:hypothetical protein GCM10009868_12520 [Terrabacter aerolatus]|uniref:DUF5666 domain-containing protein n=1 Tax=Terrabacter aerolatus TaxID=422442 RepID=A0A512CY23_9MICO|nr:DUF5666 domain-containing protein [Terrabacter aerolatus]GEO29108.1 hypothetical protein TAE01_09180 [Terrabacter aerolatus]